MIPIFLWSVVVIHDVHPCSSRRAACVRICGRARLRRAVVVSVSVLVVMATVCRGGFLRDLGRRLLLVDLLALLGALLTGGLDVGGLAVEPRLVLVERNRPHAGAHVGVVAPAELGALAAVDP